MIRDNTKEKKSINRCVGIDCLHGSARQSGLTVIELTFVVVITSVLMAIAVPNFQEFIRNYRIRGATGDFVAAINHARAEAVKRGRWVIMCSSDDPEAATPVCGGGVAEDWSTGWLMYSVDDATEAAYDSGAGDELIARGQQVPTGVRVFADDDAADFLTYLSDGSLRIDTATEDVHQYGICDVRLGASGAQVSVFGPGRAHIVDCSQLDAGVTCTVQCDPTT